ncbi:ArsA family ATPase [Rhodococcus erythropolis]|uniref:ArsA family ATPase n=1 Tax=Rhodococcus erythropolis TaxID=1833 RepID=UPI001BEA52F7|nr:ArsA family ATPase [Rhodococcus erythropolis]MBT2268857.1 ArsA family ATPase [Rhodococcus erythropolis]
MPEQRSRVQLFVGKGGVGTTTLAAATAVSAAADGARVLLVSIDQAGSLADVLGVPNPRTTTPLAERLDVRQVDTSALLEEKFRGLSGLIDTAGTFGVGDHEHGSSFEGLEPEELTGSLGIQDMLGLAEIVNFSDSGDYDLVIVDCPAAAEALRILGSPSMVSEYLERLWPRHRRMVAVTGTDMRLLLLLSVVERVLATVDRIAVHLSDREKTSVRVVTAADGVSVAATRRTLSGLALAGLRVDGIVVNNLVPQFNSSAGMGVDDSPAAQWLASIRAAQALVVDELRRSTDGMSVTTVERACAEPVGLAALGEIAATFEGGTGTDSGTVGTADNIVVSLGSGAGVDSVYVMRMYLPLVDPSSLSLGRVEDDVLVGADGVRRRVRLASVLRRCVVNGAELDGSYLIIRFSPDPAVWPV